jgi:hypothetical protein
LKLDEVTLNILAGSACEGNVLRLTCGQLDRKVYEKVNKALVAGGQVEPQTGRPRFRG